MTGTILNTVAVIAAGIIGTLIGNRLPPRIRETVIAGIGLVTILIGMMSALKTEHLLIVLASVVTGGIVGEIINIDAALERLGGG